MLVFKKLLLIVGFGLCVNGTATRPNIIVIVADDLGWNDVGFHGSNQIPTPNLDALAYSGVILHNYYVNPICTPSRSALMTGFHPIHTGLQSGVLVGAAAYGLPLRFKLLPEYLNSLGYTSHIVGKWHLGSHRDVYTPVKRGFQSHFGYWTGHEDYYDKTAQELYGPVVIYRMQRGVIAASHPYGLPLRFRLLPEYLNQLGYSSHIVGKWHLGNHREAYFPTRRGFKSHVGYYLGMQDYYDHTFYGNKQGWGYDFRRDLNVSWEDYGTYSTDIYTSEATKIIHSHAALNKQTKETKPLFLYLAHQAVHSANTYSPLQAPYELIDSFKKTIKEKDRRRFAGMLSKLDESIGEVIETLAQENMLENSVIVFTTDNGGPAAGFDVNAASNWPLRGVKDTLWEGGVRGAGFLWSPLIKSRSRIAHQMMNVQDWLPTLYTAAGGSHSDLPSMDGLDLWKALSEDLESPRNLMLHNIDDKRQIAAVRVGPWKLMRGTTNGGHWDGHYGPSGRGGLTPRYDLNLVLQSPAAKALSKTSANLPDKQTIFKLRKQVDVKCKMPKDAKPCKPKQQVCLFNITADPCETNNLAFKYGSVIKMLEETLQIYNSTAVPPGNVPIDPRGDPKFYDYTWTNWMDIVEPLNGTHTALDEESFEIPSVLEPQVLNWIFEKFGTSWLY